MTYDPNRLREVLDTQGRKYEWLATQLEYDPTHVYKVINGHTPFSRKFATKAAKVLGVPLGFLESTECEPMESAAG